MVRNTERVASRNLHFRKERKFVITGRGIGVVECAVKSHPAMFSRAFPPRHVNNIYFDTPEHQNFKDNVVGSANRHKFRIRWYGDQFGYIKKPVLEIKIKKGLAGTKRHYQLLPFTLEQGFTHETIIDILKQSNIPLELMEILRYLTPALLNRYYRRYYLSANRKFRITLDNKLSYTRISKYQNFFLQRIKDDNRVIMELKYDTEHDKEAGWISGGFPFRLSKNSKYVNGRDRLNLW